MPNYVCTIFNLNANEDLFRILIVVLSVSHLENNIFSSTISQELSEIMS